MQPEFMRKSGSGLRSVGIGWEDVILPGVDDPHNCMDPRHLGHSEWDQKLGKIECAFSLYDKIRWKWDDVYVLPVTLSTSGNPEFPYTRRCSIRMYLEAVIKQVWRCTLGSGSTETGESLWGRNRVYLERHLKAVNVSTYRCTPRWWLSEFRDTLGGLDDAHLEVMIQRVWTP